MMRFLKNSFLHGALLGLLLPIIAFLFWMLVNVILFQMDITTNFGEPFQFSLKTRLLLTISMNMLAANWAKNRRWDDMIRGIGVVTILMMLAWVFYYYRGDIF